MATNHAATPRRSLRKRWFIPLVVSVAAVVALASLSLTERPAPAAQDVVGIYTGTEVPRVPDDGIAQPVELGVHFEVSVAGRVIAIRYWKSQDNSGQHVGALWTAQGKQLASVKFADDQGSGWRVARLSHPVAVEPHTDYAASYYAPRGHYSSQPAFNGHPALGNKFIRATAGARAFGDSGFPATLQSSTAFYVDVLFEPDGSAGRFPGNINAEAAPPSVMPSVQTPPKPKPHASRNLAKSTVPKSKAPTSGTAAGKSSGPERRAVAAQAVPPRNYSTGSFPNSSNTGVPAGTTLKSVPGQVKSGAGWKWNGRAVVITATNAHLVGLDINGSVQNDRSLSGLTIDKTRIRCTNETNWCLWLGANATVRDTEVGGGANGSTFTSAIGIRTAGPNNVIQRVDVHHTSDGLRIDGGTTLADSYVHSLVFQGDIPGVHSDGSQTTLFYSSPGRIPPIVFRHNTIEGGNNDAIFIQAGASITIDNNYLVAVNRTGQVSSYGIGGGNSDVIGPMSITNNVFSAGWQVGTIEKGHWPSNTVISGNR